MPINYFDIENGVTGFSQKDYQTKPHTHFPIQVAFTLSGWGIQLSMLSKIAFLSESRLAHLFKKQVGISIQTSYGQYYRTPAMKLMI